MTTPAAKTETKPEATEVIEPAAVPAPAAGARLSDDELVAGLTAEEKAAGAAEAKPDAKAEAKPDAKPDAKPGEKPPEPKKEGEIEVNLENSKAIEASNRYRQKVERELQVKEQAIAKREQEIGARIAKAEAYEKAVAARDPLAVAEALGWPIDDLETLSHTLYKMSKSAAPADRAAAAATLRQRQVGTETEQLKKELAELKASMERQAQQAQQQAFVAQYTTQLASAVTDEHPLVRNALKNASAEARQEMLQLAARLEQAAGGETPEPAAVAKAYEQLLRRQAQALGFDPSKLGKQDTTEVKTPTPDHGQTKTTATLTSDLGPQTRPKSAPKTRDEAFEETERELEELERAKSRRT